LLPSIKRESTYSSTANLNPLKIRLDKLPPSCTLNPHAARNQGSRRVERPTLRGGEKPPF
jgi:hypothetical protein